MHQGETITCFTWTAEPGRSTSAPRPTSHRTSGRRPRRDADQSMVTPPFPRWSSSRGCSSTSAATAPTAPLPPPPPRPPQRRPEPLLGGAVVHEAGGRSPQQVHDRTVGVVGNAGGVHRL